MCLQANWKVDITPRIPSGYDTKHKLFTYVPTVAMKRFPSIFKKGHFGSVSPQMLMTWCIKLDQGRGWILLLWNSDVENQVQSWKKYHVHLKHINDKQLIYNTIKSEQRDQLEFVIFIVSYVIYLYTQMSMLCGASSLNTTRSIKIYHWITQRKWFAVIHVFSVRYAPFVYIFILGKDSLMANM